MFKFFFLFILILSACVCAAGQSVSQENNYDTIMVLPFENRSDRSEFNWVGESVANSLTDLLKVPGLNVISNDERKMLQQRMRIPLTTLPSLATSLKLARTGNASLLIAGKYNIIPATQDVAAKITINAKLIRVNEGTFLSEDFPDGSRKTREIDLFDALGNLQTVQGQLAYQILYQRDKALSFSQNELIELANKVPAKAFEAYTKGLLTGDDAKTRENYFKNAMRIFAEERSGEVYDAAALELGHMFFNSRDYDEAISYFAQIPDTSSNYPEGAFYIGVIYWKQKNYEQSISVLGPLADELQMTSVSNTVGSIAVEAARATTKDNNKAAKFMADGVGYLRKAAEDSENDPEPRFNYGFALMMQEDYKGAADSLRPVLANNPRDGEAHFLLAKCLEKLGDPASVDFDDQARRFLTAGNRYATLESGWKKNSLEGIELRVDQPTRREFVSVILIKNKSVSPVRTAESETVTLLRNATELYGLGRDDDAMVVLRRILIQEPMNADSYLLLGKIHFRRGDMEQAVSSLKTALFWNSQLIDAHILLGRVYIQKGDCLQAQNYSKSALAINSEDQNAIGLERQAERCSK